MSEKEVLAKHPVSFKPSQQLLDRLNAFVGDGNRTEVLILAIEQYLDRQDEAAARRVEIAARKEMAEVLQNLAIVTREMSGAAADLRDSASKIVRAVESQADS